MLSGSPPLFSLKIYLLRCSVYRSSNRQMLCGSRRIVESEGGSEEERNVGCDCNSIPFAPRSSSTSPVRPFAFVFVVRLGLN